jgi:nucleoid-associated protein YgaU
MGLWNFMKSTGKKIFGDDEEVDAGKVQDELKELGLDAEGLDLKVEGDKVKISSVGMPQDIKEKVILAVGNLAGVAEVEDDSPADAPAPVFHTVEKGDTLWAVASKTLGNGARYQEIFEANKPMLSHPDKIYPGQVLRIPQDA